MEEITFTIDETISPPDLTFKQRCKKARTLYVDWCSSSQQSESDEKNEIIQDDRIVQEIPSSIKNQIDSSLIGVVSSMNNVVARMETAGTQINETSRELYGLTKGNKKGQIFENTIESIFQNMFQSNYVYENMAKTPHSGDGLLTSKTGLQIMIEAKNYSYPVNTDQVIKLRNDMKTTGVRYALMLSANSGIQCKNNIDCESFVHDDKTFNIVFVSYIFDEEHKIQSGVMLLEQLYKMESVTSHAEMKQLYDSIASDLSELNTIIDNMNKLKSKFHSMEKVMKEQLDSFYGSIRDTEYTLKRKLQNVWGNIESKCEVIISESDDIIANSNPKFTTILSKINDILTSMKFILITRDDETQIINEEKKKKVGILKCIAKRVDITIYEPDVKLSITNENFDFNGQFLQIILHDNKRMNNLS
jgi:hypothetical protein